LQGELLRALGRELVEQFVMVGVWILPPPLGIFVVGEMWRWEGCPLEILDTGGRQSVK